MQRNLFFAMVDHDAGNPARIQHFTKVTAYAMIIAEQEGCDEATCALVETAALVHDIGIKPSLERFGSSAGNYQQQLGPPLAEEMLRSLDYDEAVIDRVCQLVGRHHVYTDIDGIDCQILIEADFLVNMLESKYIPVAIESVRDSIFQTATGLQLLHEMFVRKEDMGGSVAGEEGTTI